MNKGWFETFSEDEPVPIIWVTTIILEVFKEFGGYKKGFVKN